MSELKLITHSLVSLSVSVWLCHLRSATKPKTRNNIIHHNLTHNRSGAGPIYNEILTRLSVLKPTSINLEDDSSKHAGHAGSKGFDGESHFSLDIAAQCFEDLPLVKRHKLIYTILGDVMDKIHALEIRANVE